MNDLGKIHIADEESDYPFPDSESLKNAPVVMTDADIEFLIALYHATDDPGSVEDW